MLITKITTGFVAQEFDTETRKFTKQEFIAGDESDWEHKGTDELVDMAETFPDSEPYLPFNMEQPER